MDEKFRTEIEIKPGDWKINYHSRLLFIGSCFTDNIGVMLLRNKFQALVNPFGVLFNPASIAQVLTRSIKQGLFDETELVFHNGLYHLLDLHGEFSNISPTKVIESGNKALTDTREFLLRCDYLFITFGTAWVYEYRKSGSIVSNCHKIPAGEFNRRRLLVDEITMQWKTLMAEIKNTNPEIKVVFTVSPVRHLKDSAHGNQLSKSVLLLAIDNLQQLMPSVVEYFPAYEIVMDELRDYRFYSDDMIHLTTPAIEFIFNRFEERYFSLETKSHLRKIKKIMQAAEHKIIHENASENQKFSDKMLGIIKSLEGSHININFQKEIKYFRSIHSFNE